MEEKIQDEKIRETLSASVEHTLRLPIGGLSPRTTAKGRFLQAMRLWARRPVRRHPQSLLDIALKHSKALSTLVCTAKSNKGLSATEITHSLLSGSEEAYSLVTCHQKQRLCLLRLRLCLTDGVLTIHAEAPLSLWLQSALEQSHSNLLLYHVVLSSLRLVHPIATGSARHNCRCSPVSPRGCGSCSSPSATVR